MYGLVGSTAITPTDSSRALNRSISPAVIVDFPAPGGPVIPMSRGPSVPVCSSWSRA